MPYARLRLTFCAFSHFIMDFACFFALYSGALKTEQAALFVLLYNFIAFALQALAGAFADRIGDNRAMAVMGCGLTALGVMAMGHPLLSVLSLGLGNALFHVGGAVMSLRDRPGDALFAGVFVAPGALGTAYGLLSAQQGTVTPVYVIFLLLLCTLLLWGVGPGAPRNAPVKQSKNEPLPLGAGALTLCLGAICVRSFAGFSADGLGGMAAFVLLGGFASFLGKLLGGALARKLPWRTVALLGVGSGGLLMAFFPQSYVLYLGILLFNLAMPITLAAVTRSLPGHYGLGFGLTTLALFAGTMPLYALPDGYTAPAPLMAGLTVGCAVLLFLLLRPADSITLKEEPPHEPDPSA